jgi:hypothetical protein
LIKKFEKDEDTLKQLFSGLKANVVENSVSPINNFHGFLTSNYAFLSVSVQNLKETYGDFIKWKTIVKEKRVILSS